MSSKVESMMGDDEDFSNGLLLRDIEEISKALYLHTNPTKAFNASSDQRANLDAKTGMLKSKSEFDHQDPSFMDKKSSMWNWKPLKALAHIRNKRFNCCFFLNVHVIEGLPSHFENLNLFVTWEHKGDMLRTCAAPVCDGMVEFEETLMYRCTVYANRTRNLNSAKYEPKLFSLRTSVIGVPELEIGKEMIDLTRLLPLAMEEFERDKRSSGKWTTSFKLSGKAKGAILNVSFGFYILDANSFEPGYFVKVPGGGRNSGTHPLHNLGSVLTDSRRDSHHHWSRSVDTKFLGEILPNQGAALSRSISLLYQKLDEGKMGNAVKYSFFDESLESMSHSPDSAGGNSGHEYSDASYSDRVRIEADYYPSQVEERERENDSQRFDNSVIETIDIAEIFKEEEESALIDNVELIAKLDKVDYDEEENVTDNNRLEKNDRSFKEATLEELDSVFYEMLAFGSEEMGSVLDTNNYDEQENYNKTKLAKSSSLDDIADSIEDDFLNMLSLEASTATGGVHDSPRDFFLRQIEQDKIAWEDHISKVDSLADHKEYKNDDLSFSIQEVEKNHESIESLRSKRNAKMLENLETESLMHEWGLNEKAFQNSPRCSSGAFGSPVYIPAEEPLKLPSLAEGIGPIIRTRVGGFLRSMNPLLFRDAKNGARLIVQVSAPVVLPPAMGLTAMEILQCWASEGVEKISTRVKELMALEDVTGKTIHQLVSEAKSVSDDSKRWTLQHESEGVPSTPFSDSPYCSFTDDLESECVSFENLVPMAITNIEGLLIEGLKIQSGIPDQEAPSSIKVQSLGLGARDVDKLVKFSVSLEEWMRLDCGDFDSKNEPDENISKVIAAHRAACTESSKEDETIKLLDRKCGILDNKFRMALRLQLRDPFRNYETVGSSMLALFQVERVYAPSQPDGMDEKITKEGIESKQEERMIPLFRILEVHLAGLNVLPKKQRFWGTDRQQQAGYRWLLSSGIAKNKKNHISGLNTIVKSPSRFEGGDVLWSISSRTGGEAAPWDEQVAFNVHVRNPDIILPNECPKN